VSVPCPFLPLPERPLTHEDIHQLGVDRSARFHGAALGYAQTMWLNGYPAKSLLLISRALACRLEDVSLLAEKAKPYHAVAWLVQNRAEESFIGNPRRHYQHLASRMVEPHRELRRWRAWACWYLMRQLLSETEFPSDTRQIREESTVEPRRGDIVKHLEELSPRDDLAAWEEALEGVETNASKKPIGSAEIKLVPINQDQVEEVQHLAHRIWPVVYPSIISMEQIRYMLVRFYDLEKLKHEISAEGVRYALIKEGEHTVGYVGWQPQDAGRTAFLSKLYLLPDRHGRGLGAKALEWIAAEARGAGCSRLMLRVNRNNHQAIRAYLRAGFAFEENLCTGIGGGFVMDDYVMTRPL